MAWRDGLGLWAGSRMILFDGSIMRLVIFVMSFKPQVSVFLLFKIVYSYGSSYPQIWFPT
jgi:hypothetical protein